MQKFKRFGFRRNTHTKDGIFKSDNNIWQVHVWNRSDASFVGRRMVSKKAMSFEEIVKVCNDYAKSHDNSPELVEEEIAYAIISMIECGLVEIEKIEDYETDIYDEEVMFWNE